MARERFSKEDIKRGMMLKGGEYPAHEEDASMPRPNKYARQDIVKGMRMTGGEHPAVMKKSGPPVQYGTQQPSVEEFRQRLAAVRKGVEDVTTFLQKRTRR